MFDPTRAPLLSLLIPTRDRYETLVPVVRAILAAIPDPRLEIVICDNSARPASDRVAELAFDEPRIRYDYDPRPLSMADNTVRGISLCRGEFVCFIGDDDMVSPFIMDIVEWMAGDSLQCLIYPPASYWWHDVQFARETRTQHPGVFWLPEDRDATTKIIDAEAELEKILSKGGVAYDNLPRLYHGVVAWSALDRVRERFGTYVPGPSPDMALSLALAITNSKHIWLGYPVTVFGASRNSGGGLTAARRHYGQIEDQSFLPSDILERWDKRLPRLWSEQLIYPQTIHEVLALAGRENTLSYEALYGSLIAYEPFLLPHLLPILKAFVMEDLARLPRLAFEAIKKMAGRARFSLRKRQGWGFRYDVLDLPSIDAVAEFMASLPPPAALRLVSKMDSKA